MSVTITRDEWLAEVERVLRQHRPDADGFTAQELADQWGCCRAVALKRLGMIRDRLIVGHRSATGISGRHTTVPTYKLARTEAKRR